jgi:protein required for attachment to host cells
MSKMKIGTGDWIVVCDGRKALILENIGDRMFPNLHAREVREHPVLSTSAQGSDAPGRVHQSMGSERSSIEQTDWHEESERAFLKALAERLDVAVTSGETAGLTVASPRAGHDPVGLFRRGSQGASCGAGQGSRQNAGP